MIIFYCLLNLGLFNHAMLFSSELLGVRIFINRIEKIKNEFQQYEEWFNPYLGTIC